MKKLVPIICLLALLVSGCTQEEILQNGTSASGGRTFTTAFEQNESRTYLEDGKYSYWTEDDRISLFDGSTLNQQYIFSGETGDDSGTFFTLSKPEGTGAALNTNYAVYPYSEDVKMSSKGVITVSLPSEQHYAENSYGLGDNTMVAVTENTDDTFLNFKNVGGYVKLQLYGDDVTVKSITLTGNNGEKIAGEATITALYDKAPTVSMADGATTSITLDCGEKGVKIGSTPKRATAFWMVIPPTTFDKGFTIKVKDVDGKVFTQTTDKQLAIERNVVKPMATTETKPQSVEIPYLTFTADEAQTLTMTKAVATLEYSLNGIDWEELGTKTIEFGGEKGKLRLRGKNLYGTANSKDECATIQFGNAVAVTSSGDIRTLLDYDNVETVKTNIARFCNLFYGCTPLVTAPQLPAKDLAERCYYGMFEGCTSLTQAPELPATVLAEQCYTSMFNGCNNLTTAPKLPATELANHCYAYMFQGCTALTSTPQLLATVLVNGCYKHMFYGCSNLKKITMLATNISALYCLDNWLHGISPTGTFIKAKEMTSLPSGESGIPTGWDVENFDFSSSDKKLVGMAYNRYSINEVLSTKNVATFTYDDEGRLISWGGTQYYLKEGTTLEYNHTLTWNGNKCTETTDYDDDIVVHYVFEDNMMKSSTWGTWTQTFTYNDDKQLIRVDHSDYDIEDGEVFETFQWENGKLMQGGDGVTLSYSNQTINGFNPAIFLFENDILEDVNLALTNPELVGLRINHLVSSITDYYSVWNFSYTLYDDGYIKSCTIVETRNNGDKYTEEYFFEWK